MDQRVELRIADKLYNLGKSFRENTNWTAVVNYKSEAGQQILEARKFLIGNVPELGGIVSRFQKNCDRWDRRHASGKWSDEDKKRFDSSGADSYLAGVFDEVVGYDLEGNANVGPIGKVALYLPKTIRKCLIAHEAHSELSLRYSMACNLLGQLCTASYIASPRNRVKNEEEQKATQRLIRRKHLIYPEGSDKSLAGRRVFQFYTSRLSQLLKKGFPKRVAFIGKDDFFDTEQVRTWAKTNLEESKFDEAFLNEASESADTLDDLLYAKKK